MAPELIGRRLFIIDQPYISKSRFPVPPSGTRGPEHAPTEPALALDVIASAPLLFSPQSVYDNFHLSNIDGIVG
jgi:hypothetical protein